MNAGVKTAISRQAKEIPIASVSILVAIEIIIKKCMEKEDGYMKYPITSLLLVQDHLDDLLLSRYNKPVLQTHKT